MKLASSRTLEKLRPTLMNPNSQGSETVYWVFSQISQEKFVNLTVITPQKIGEEFAKTYGHYHGAQVLETYKLISGEGVLVMQKKTDEVKKVSEVLLVRAHPGDEIVIPPEYGHSWSNVGVEPLLSFDDWQAGHTPGDYQVMEQLHGMAYYLTGTPDKIIPVANPNYENIPAFKWIEAKDLKLNQ